MIVHGSKDRIKLGITREGYFPDDILMVTESGFITIGDYVILGFHIKLLCGYHDYTVKLLDRYPPATSGFDITINNGAWICSAAIIIGPCVIGENSVIGAGSVVTHDVPPNQVWAGNPAKFIKNIEFK